MLTRRRKAFMMVPRASLSGLSTDELRIIMQMCTVQELLRLARCSRSMLAIATHRITWCTQPVCGVTVESLPRIARSLMRFVPTCITISSNRPPVHALSKMASIVGVKLSMPSERMLELFGKLPQLHVVYEISISSSFDTYHLDYIARALPHLQRLRIWKCTTNACMSLARLTQLREFTLDEISDNENFALTLAAALDQLVDLRVLSLGMFTFQPDTIPLCVSALTASRLTTLCLFGATYDTVFSWNAYEDLWKRLTSLRTFKLYGRYDFVSSLAGAASLPALTHFVMGTNYDHQDIAEAACVALRNMRPNIVCRVELAFQPRYSNTYFVWV
jgi:hypothetical protein